MRGFESIRFVSGMNQALDPELSPGFTTLQNVDFQKMGSIEAAKKNDVSISYGTKVHSIISGGLTTSETLLSGVGTSVYQGPTQIKTGLSGERIEGTSLSNRIYITNKDNGLWNWNGTYYRAGAPTPTLGAFAAAAGAGTGFTGDYFLYVTYVNSNGFEGNPSAMYTVPVTLANEDFSLTDIPVNADTDYNIGYRRIYIEGGTTPAYASPVLAYTISDNTTTTATIATTDVDTTTDLETDNNTPPYGDYIAEHYNVLFLAGISTDPNLLYYSKLQASGTGVENWPTAQAIRVSRSGDPIMWIEEWDGVLWVVTKKKVYQVIGSPGSGTLSTNFYIKETASFKGTIAPRSCQFTPYGGFFLSEDGIRKFNGTTSTVFSNEIKDELDGRNTMDSVEKLAVSAFWDDKLVFSFAYGSSLVNNRTVIYDFRAESEGIKTPWIVHEKGYNDLEVDRATNTLHCATENGIERFRNGAEFAAWVIDKTFPLQPETYYSRGKFQVDMEGTATAEVYLDDTLFSTHSLSAATRQLITRRFPAGLTQRARIKLTGEAKTTKDKIYSISYSAEVQRGQV